MRMVLPLIALGGVALGALSERYGISTPFGKAQALMTPTNKSVEQQAYDAMRARLLESEGYRNDAYIDTLGFLTVGIGHRIVAGDNIKKGQYISNERIETLFKKDADKAFKAAVSQSVELGKYNVDMVVALTEVNFQLGTAWRREFPNTWSLLKSGKKEAALRNLKVSKWNRQTPVRVKNFAEAIQRNYA